MQFTSKDFLAIEMAQLQGGRNKFSSPFKVHLDVSQITVFFKKLQSVEY